MAKPAKDLTTDPYERRWNREVVIVAALVGLMVLIGAIYTLMNGPQPTEGAGGVVPGVEGRVTPSGAVRPTDDER
jgi:hypothetical protein